MKNLRRLVETTQAQVDLALLALRVCFGGVLAASHGWPKVLDLSAFVPKVAKLGFPLPELFAFAAAAAEFGGGLLLALGLGTRIAAVPVLTTMLTAVFVAHAADPFVRKELALANAVVAIVLLIAGPGRFSLDRVFFGRRS